MLSWPSWNVMGVALWLALEMLLEYGIWVAAVAESVVGKPQPPPPPAVTTTAKPEPVAVAAAAEAPIAHRTRLRTRLMPLR